MNLSYLLEMNARKYPDKEALVMGEQRITYGEPITKLPRNASGKVLKHHLRSEEPATQQ